MRITSLDNWISLKNLRYCPHRCFPFITFYYRHRSKSQLCKERRSEKARETREETQRKVEVRAPHERRADPALRVVLRYASRRPHPFCTHPPFLTPHPLLLLLLLADVLSSPRQT